MLHVHCPDIDHKFEGAEWTISSFEFWINIWTCKYLDMEFEEGADRPSLCLFLSPLPSLFLSFSLSPLFLAKWIYVCVLESG